LKKGLIIHDIAQHLQVSIATVSLVLNGKAKAMRISDALAERVRQYVAEVGYQPNHLAKSLRTGKTHVIALLVEEIANPFFATTVAPKMTPPRLATYWLCFRRAALMATSWHCLLG
jgi:LacI family transcriptional regulator